MRRKSVLLSAMVLGLVGALIAASTTASFTDQAISTDNDFAAGTLYMDLDGECAAREFGGTPSDEGVDGNTGCTITDSFSASNIAPGDPATSHTFNITNLGSLDGTLSANAVAAVDAGHPDCDASNFVITQGPLSTTTLLANEANTATYEVSVQLSSGAPNACQGATGTISVTFDLVQA